MAPWRPNFPFQRLCSRVLNITGRNFFLISSCLIRYFREFNNPYRLMTPIFWNLEIRFDIFSKLTPLMHLANSNTKRKIVWTKWVTLCIGTTLFSKKWLLAKRPKKSQKICNFSIQLLCKVPSIYYVITCNGGGEQKMVFFAYFY